MSNLNATFLRTYPKKQKDGTYKDVFVYVITGTPENIKRYEEAQGEFLVIDEKLGKHLWFTQNSIGRNGSIVVTDEHKVYADLSEMKLQVSFIKSLGGNLGTELAKITAIQMTGGASTSAPKQDVKEKLGEL